jgi:hypothetical protein
MKEALQTSPWAKAYDERTRRLIALVLGQLGLGDKDVRVELTDDADWNGASWAEGDARFLEVNLGTAFLAEDLFTRLLAHREVWPELGTPEGEGTPTVDAFFENAEELFRFGSPQGYARPTIVCPVRRAYAMHVAAIAWDFLVLHELGHIVLGHVAYDASVARGTRREPRRATAATDAAQALEQQGIEFDADSFSTTWLFRVRRGGQYEFERLGLAKSTCLAMDIVRAVYGLFLLLCAGREDDAHVLDQTHPPPRLRQFNAAIGFATIIGARDSDSVVQDMVRMDDYYPRLVVGERVDADAIRERLVDPHSLRIMAAQAKAREVLRPFAWDPKFYASKSFRVPSQADKVRGCIPACAIAVMGTLQCSRIPSETVLVDQMWVGQKSGSGFERLRVSLSGSVAVEIEAPGAGRIGERVAALTEAGKLVLVAVKNPAAHCVVVELVSRGHVYFHDPGDGYPHVEDAAAFFGRATGDFATLSIV